MLKINNKGQSLVMFILIIPIFLLILTLVYDVGNAIYEKDRLSNTNYLTIEYGLNNIDTVTENDLKNLIEQNTSNLKYIYVTIEENQIEIKTVGLITGLTDLLFLPFVFIDNESSFPNNLKSSDSG